MKKTIKGKIKSFLSWALVVLFLPILLIWALIALFIYPLFRVGEGGDK
jgi:predicted ABC-type exoprotein transport system permease subunit